MKNSPKKPEQLSVKAQKLLLIIKNFTRINEIFYFSFMLSLLGQFIALRGAGINWNNFILIAVINTLNSAFAFMINDIEDAEDDAKDPKKSKRNPISSKRLSRQIAQIITFLLIPTSFILSWFVNIHVAIVSVASIVLGFLYSWKKVRLKNIVVVDAVSHALYLSVLIFLSGYVSVRPISLNEFDIPFWLIVMGSFIFSVSGSLANQYRDYEVDRKVMLKSSSNYLTKNVLKVVMACTMVIGGALLLTGAFLQADIIKGVFAVLVSLVINVVLYAGYKLISKESEVELHTFLHAAARIVMFMMIVYMVI